MQNNYYQPSLVKPKLYDSFGFTLLEILLSVAIMGALAGLSIPVYQSFQVTNDLDIAANTVAQACRKATIMSQGMANDTSWGVKIQAGSIVIFQGASYLSRNSAYDEIFVLPLTITPSGSQELLFSKFSGLPAGDYSLTLTSSNNQVRTISLNAKGIVGY